MGARKRLSEGNGGSYFTSPTSPSFIPSGCALLDCVLGGGYAEGRITNIVGDESTGKTLLAIEVCANFARKYPEGTIHYAEVEAAFDTDYAEVLGLPVEQVNFVEDCYTVEDMFEYLNGSKEKKIEGLIQKVGNAPTLFILDSLDALSDRAELDREIDKGTFGAEKAKKMSQLFRRLVQHLAGKKVTVIIVSQVRDKIGVAFGRKYNRAGGRALNFYSSQIFYLSQMGMRKKVKNKIERAVGVNIKAKCTKNKISLPFRECEFPILFAFGIDDVTAGIDWLTAVKRLDALSLKNDVEAKQYLRGLVKLSQEDYGQERQNVSEAVREVWEEIEKSFMPLRRKY